MKRTRLRLVGTIAAMITVAACGGRILAEDAPDAGGVARVDASAPTVIVPPPKAEPPDARPPLPPKKPSLPDSAQSVELGNHRGDEELSFSVPGNTLGFTLSVQANRADEYVQIASLVSPAGDIVLKDGKPRGTEVPTAEGYDGWATASVPQADVYRKSPVEPGVWKLKLFSHDNSRLYRVRLTVQRTSDGFFHGGELDLHVYVPEGLMLSQPGPRHEVRIDDAYFDDALNARIDAFYDLLETTVGIGRGNVSFHGIPAKFASIDFTSMELYEAFRETRVEPDAQALHVVFTNELGGGALGVAPAIPGNAVETGTSFSAIAVTQFEDSSPGLDAFTMVHEMGHFGGLSHTTEINDDTMPDAGAFYDPLADTPLCDGGVTAESIDTCPDISNIMFPTGDQETGVLTVSQIRVLRGSSVYRARQTGPIIAPPRMPLRPPAPVHRLPNHVRRCHVIRRGH